MRNTKKALALLLALTAAMCLAACGENSSAADSATDSGAAAETTTAAAEERTAAPASAATTSASAETTSTAAAVKETETTDVSRSTEQTEESEGRLPVPGEHDFTLPEDCPYDFDSISFHARNYYEQHTGTSVQYAEAEKLNGDILTVRLYDIVEFRPLDYAYYYVDYHDLKGKDQDGNPVDLESTETTVWFPGEALNSIDFEDCWGAALYLGRMNDDEDFDRYCVRDALSLPMNAAYAEKYSFIAEIPERNYVSPVGGAQGGSELWMIVPRPTNQKTRIMVKNIDPNTGDPVGLVYNSAFGTPFILACNASGKPDFEITFLSEAIGTERTFKVFVAEATSAPMCTDGDIRILN